MRIGIHIVMTRRSVYFFLQKSSSHQFFGYEEVFESFHLPEANGEKNEGLYHSPPQHFAVGFFTNFTKKFLLFLNQKAGIMVILELSFRRFWNQ